MKARNSANLSRSTISGIQTATVRSRVQKLSIWCSSLRLAQALQHQFTWGRKLPKDSFWTFWTFRLLVDSSGVSIGKRYARNDELGTPLAITVDFDSLKDGSFTLRERDTTTQVRASQDEILEATKNLVLGAGAREQVFKRLPTLSGQSQDE